MIFRKKDKFLLQMSADLTSGFTGGISCNIPIDMPQQDIHALYDKMHKVLDRKRAEYEYEVFADKLDVTREQLNREIKTKGDLSDKIAEIRSQGQHARTVDENMLENCSTNIERLAADVKLGEEAVERVKQRMAA